MFREKPAAPGVQKRLKFEEAPPKAQKTFV